jgi:energy-coupling factor transport system ATP-binding protein
MNNGQVSLDGSPTDIFSECQTQLKEAGVDVPPLTLLMDKFNQRGLAVDHTVVAMDTATESVLAALGRR